MSSTFTFQCCRSTIRCGRYSGWGWDRGGTLHPVQPDSHSWLDFSDFGTGRNWNSRTHGTVFGKQPRAGD
jgi:hypothetical protein